MGIFVNSLFQRLAFNISVLRIYFINKTVNLTLARSLVTESGEQKVCNKIGGLARKNEKLLYIGESGSNGPGALEIWLDAIAEPRGSSEAPEQKIGRNEKFVFPPSSLK